ncbi:MAG: DUF4279 domain-containing protein [Elusimicrobia bacterium]|nr:DUF4279 domain-containing protein [Elusimicrobiota bacterium]
MRQDTDVRLKISSLTMTPQDIEASIGLQPDEFWRIGDHLGAFGAPARQHGFVIESGAQASLPFQEYITALIGKVAPAAQKIGSLALSDKCIVEFICTLHRKTAPLLTFQRDDLRWIAVMGAVLRIDTFVESAARAAARAPSGSGEPDAGTPKF